ncbi:MAG: ribosomal protein S18-alanine N-acetyltransferase [Sulfobacillus sp.]
MSSQLADDLQVVRMALADLTQVLEIEHLSYPTPWSRRAFVSELTENAYAHYLAAKSGSRLVGYVGMWLVLDEAHITNVAVHPTVRHRGVGRLLMETAIDLTEEHGCRTITLEVRRTNQVAQTLYRSLGFQMTGVRKGYYTDNGEDALIMVREKPPASAGA